MFSGHNRARNGSGDQRIVIELLDEGIAADSFDVDLGRGRQRSKDPADGSAGGGQPKGLAWKILGGVAVIGVLIGAIAWMQRNPAIDKTAEQLPTTTLPSSTTRGPGSFADAPPSTSPPSPTVVTLQPTMMLMNGGQPIIDMGDPGTGELGLFLLDENNRSELFRLDLRQGIVRLFEEGDSTGDIVAMVNTAQGPKVVWAPPSSSWTEVLPNRDGTYWERRDRGRVGLRDGVTGDLMRELESPWASVGVDWVDLAGVTSLGEPVMSGLDGRYYRLAADGTLAAFSNAFPVSLDYGSYAAVVCLDDGSCQRELRTSIGTYVEPLLDDAFQPVMFSPDGRYAIEQIYSDGDASSLSSFLVDLATGGRIEVSVGESSNEMDMSTGVTRRSAWSPDSRYYFGTRRAERFGEPATLVVLEAATGTATEIPLPAEIGPVIPIAVM